MKSLCHMAFQKNAKSSFLPKFESWAERSPFKEMIPLFDEAVLGSEDHKVKGQRPLDQ